MVLRGQFLERPTLIPTADELILEGVSHRGHKTPLVLVLPPPPIEGGGMDHVVGAEVAFAVTRLGFGSLRFNYRGVAGSQGKISKNPEDWLIDARAALQVARENGPAPHVVLISIGASDAVAARLAKTESLAGLGFVSPTLLTPADVTALRGAFVSVVLAEHDRQDRGGLSAALEAIDGAFTIVPGATRAFQRGLTQVGQAVAKLTERASRELTQAPEKTSQ